VAQEYLECLEW